MNVLIIEDDNDKRELLKTQLTKIDENAKIRWYDTYQQAMLFINDNYEYIDLILLDWCFPPNSFERSKYGMGRQVIANMSFHNYSNKVIICSSDEVFIDQEEYPFVLGSIIYGPEVDIAEEIKGLLSPEVKEQPRVKTNKPKRPDTGYKRRRSSTPWWMK